MCEEAKIDLPRFSVITPFPNTKFYEELDSEGRIIEKDWALYDVEHVVYEPKNMTKEELEEGIKWAWKQSYSWKSIMKRMDLTKLKTIKTIYMALNIGYRKYAKGYKIYDETVMSDNSDSPDPVTKKGKKK